MKLRGLGLGACIGLFTACSSTTINNNNQSDAGPGTDSGTDSGTDAPVGADASDGGRSVLGFTPSNVDLSGLDVSQVGDVDISGANCGILDTEGLGWSCVDQSLYVATTITLADQSKLSIFVVKSLRVEASSLIDVRTGHVPVAIVALGTMTFLGSLKVQPGIAGGAFNAQSETRGSGPGGGLGGPGSAQAGGGGASFCGVGGAGTAEAGATPYGKSTAYGTPELIPLVGGSAGGAGAIGAFTGSGGGAVELVAGTSIDLKAGAFISAPGSGGGQGGLAGGQEASGGGSGGAILLEAPQVTIAGALAANGGGGGSGAGGPAAGGAPSATDHGGNGAAGGTVDGADGLSSMGSSAAGGGGAAGRIRINTTNGKADVSTATLSPSPMTCFTQGMLKK